MFPAERQGRIVELLKEQRAVRVASLSDLLGVSEMTIRRDLERLANDGILSRTHGGAILRQRMVEEPRYVLNVRAHTEEKERISRAAARLIKQGETVFLGSGTTASQLLAHVDPQVEARIVTHNLGVVTSAHGTSLDVVLIGGQYRPHTNSVEGALAVEIVSRFHAPLFILGCDGLSLEEGLTTPSLGLAGVERAMLRQTRGEVVVLADHSKIGVVGDAVICPLDDIQTIIVDDGVDGDVRDEMRRRGIRVVVA